VGKSNYGIWRTFTVLFDLARLKFLMSFMQRPLQLFGGIAALMMLISLGISAYIAWERLVRGVTLGVLGPSIFLAATAMFLMSILLFCVGLLAELMVKLYYDAARARPYVVEHITNEMERPIHPWPEEPVHPIQLPERRAGGAQ